MATLIVRERTSLETFLAKHPHIKKGKVLTGDYIILNVDDEDTVAVMEVLGNTRIDMFSIVVGLMGKEALDVSGITEIQQQPFLDLRGHGVLLGFVDTGIDYTQSAFKYEDNTTKIKYIWDQTLEGNAPEGYGFGAEFTDGQINGALASADPFEVVPHRDTVGHGTFLASVAGSREEGEYIGAAPDSEIIMVKLRGADAFYRELALIPPWQENAYETADVMQGIEFIIEKASELGRPVAICISVGSNQGGHDGYTVFEEYISRIANNAGVAVCSAAGNENGAAHHTSGIIAKNGDVETVELNVPEDSGDVYIHILSGASDKISVSIISPTGEMVARVPARNGAEFTSKLIFENAVIQIYYFFPVEGSGSQITFIKIWDATPGLWQILIHGDIIIGGKYDVWLSITGFVSPGVEFLSPDPECTIVVPATATGVIACGAYDALSKSLYAQSSWGPSRLPAILPDIAAPGTNVKGIFPTGYGKMSGTSVAAAITAGACALLLQWGIVNKNETHMDTHMLRAILIRGCTRDPGIIYPNNQWGYGRLNLQKTFELLRVI